MEIKKSEITLVKTQASKAVATAEKIVVTNDEQMLEAGDVRKKIKQVGKMIDEKKKSITEPINAALKEVRELFRPIEDNCEQAEKIIAGKMLAYQSEQDRKRREAEEKAAKELEEQQAKLEAGKITEKQFEKTVAKVETKLEKAPEAITKSSSFHTRTVKKFRITNIDRIPRVFMVPNEVAIREEMRADRAIEGVEYYEEKVMV